MRKKETLIGLVFIFILLSSFVVTAETVCCEKTIDLSEDDNSTRLIFECLNAPIEQCAEGSRTASTSCDETSYCQLGTCINTNTGTCMPNAPRQPCIDEGGYWVPEDKEDVLVCQEGCCGEGVAFVTETECKQIATEYGIDTNFRPDITDQETCYALASVQVKGACVTEAEFTDDCEIKTRDNCPEDSTFHEGFLCTAPGVSDCAKSANTKCEDSQVYFLDSCNNLANVYDTNMFTDENDWTSTMENYWTYIQEPNCEVIGSSNTCGNCDYEGGTMCKEYENGAYGMPNNAPSPGNFVCADLSCSYDTNGDGTNEIYQHGESWCAESAGTYWHLPGIISSTLKDGTKDPLREDSFNSAGALVKAGLENSSAYNLPGSRYYQLQCWDGEVIPYDCKPFRNEVCKEVNMGTTDSPYMYARCWVNDWRSCFEITTAIDCEDALRDCTWISGHKFDREVVEDIDEDGSCVPLYAPGFDFWEQESDAHTICALGTTQERVFYETYWMTARDESDAPLGLRKVFSDVSTTDAAHRCLENCYAIPDYGTSGGLTPALVSGLYSGERLANNVRTYTLSTRRGHYCSDLFKEEAMATGRVMGKSVSCTNNENRRASVLFYTHQQWLDFVRTRARSLGDCGLTNNFVGVSGEPGAELITAIFQKLNQDGTPKNESPITETIYIGNERIFDEYRLNE